MIATYRQNKLLYILIFSSFIIFSYLWAQNPIIKSLPLLFLLLVFVFLFVMEFPVYSFMIFLTIYADIGGYFGQFSYFGLPSRVQIRDVALILCFLPLLSDRIKDKRFWNDKAFRKLLIVLFAFTLYQILVSELIKRSPSLSEFIWFFLDHRWLLFGVYIAIPAYIIIKQDAKKVFNFMVFVTAIVMVIYFTTLFTGINLMKIVTMERFSETSMSGMMRVSMVNYGYMPFVVFMALAIYVLKYKYKYRKILMFAAIAMVLTQLITLSRISLFFVFGNMFMLVIVAIKFLKISLSRSINRLIVGTVIITILIFIFFPKYPIYLYKTYKGTFMEMSGKVPRGTYQTRTEKELPRQIGAFKTDPFFGYGYKEGAFSYVGPKSLDLSDIPLLGNLALYGIFGLSLYLYTYVLIYRRIKYVYRRIRSNLTFANLLNKYEIVLLLVLISYFFSLVFFRLFYFSKELIDGRIYWGFIFSMLFVLANKLETDIIKQKY